MAYIVSRMALARLTSTQHPFNTFQAQKCCPGNATSATNATRSQRRSERFHQLATSSAGSLQSLQHPQHPCKESDSKMVGTVGTVLSSTAASAAMGTTWREDVPKVAQHSREKQRSAISVRSLFPSCDSVENG